MTICKNTFCLGTPLEKFLATPLCIPFFLQKSDKKVKKEREAIVYSSNTAPGEKKGDCAAQKL